MSGFLAGKVWQSALSPRLKPLTAALADFADDDGNNIYPSVAYMAWKLGDDQEPTEKPRMESTVHRGLRDLIALGILEHVGYRRTKDRGRVDRGGRNTTKEYRLVEARLPARPAWSERYPKGSNLTPFSGSSIGVTAESEKVSTESVKGAADDTRSVREKTQEDSPDQKRRDATLSFPELEPDLDLALDCQPFPVTFDPDPDLLFDTDPAWGTSRPEPYVTLLSPKLPSKDRSTWAPGSDNWNWVATHFDEALAFDQAGEPLLKWSYPNYNAGKWAGLPMRWKLLVVSTVRSVVEEAVNSGLEARQGFERYEMVVDDVLAHIYPERYALIRQRVSDLRSHSWFWSGCQW